MAKAQITAAQKEQAIRAIQHEGMSVKDVSKAFGVHRATLYRWTQKKANKIPLQRQINPLSGRQPIISGQTSTDLKDILAQPATTFGYDTDLWNTTRIRQVLKKQLQVKVSKSALQRTLTKIRYAFRKPEKRYDQAKPAEQKAWKTDTIPKIKHLIGEKRAILYFLDEANLNLGPTLGKTWAPKGKPLIAKVSGKRGSVAAMSAISPNGRLLFNLFEGAKRFRSDDVIHFLDQLLCHHPRRHIAVVLDRAPCHTAKKVQTFIAKQKRLHVYYLPAYSPELNPDEQVWSYLKNQELKSHQAKTTKELKKLAMKKLKKMASNERVIKGIFFRSQGAQFFN